MSEKRLQLTLFIDGAESGEIERARRAFNPAQFALINAHVTLCREDELAQLDKIRQNLQRLDAGFVTVNFGPVIRFSEGKGCMLPAVGGNAAFHGLREKILHGTTTQPKQHGPHITLMHPRNSTCTDEVFGQIKNHRFPQSITFKKICLIEQEMGQQWDILEEYQLRTNNP